ncbi:MULTISPECIES: hypothetical protein [Pseudonocardiaceae]|uniref:Uncharacterized protein n=2 Tax=Pseudonocardiaceae TaxID=2070 RepID=F4CWP4_PSEUX|nr:MULTISPECIES: hypothetical protein [Pseudonocardiaceae]AEA23477.1 hypothetical protein Psed_1231 [Pseudonocardia dioxanivorans CB1190]SFQ19194.1 hypothetical protein SAMN05421854_109234 [Amycolatopsis rubida]
MNSAANTDLSVVADTANRAAIFEPMTNEDERPTITVAGVHVALYVDPASRQFRVSIDLDDTESWLLRSDKDSTVPLRICVQGDVTFEG